MKNLFGNLPGCGAVFEDNYRYDLWRSWSPRKPSILFIMFNPSTADATQLDRTVTRCFTFAKEWGYGTMHIANIFAYKSTDPRTLLEISDPVGPKNDEWIRTLSMKADKIVIAWGAWNWWKKAQGREKQVLEILKQIGQPLFCIGITKTGHPRHPLYTAGNNKMKEFGVTK